MTIPTSSKFLSYITFHSCIITYNKCIIRVLDMYFCFWTCALISNNTKHSLNLRFPFKELLDTQAHIFKCQIHVGKWFPKNIVKYTKVYLSFESPNYPGTWKYFHNKFGDKTWVTWRHWMSKIHVNRCDMRCQCFLATQLGTLFQLNS
jgi:hypothetical protein